jgi:hypothetical protein
MNYSVSINEAKRTITVTLADGSKGVAKCCPTDSFNISTGIELALERAKNASKPTPTVIELVKALEKALPKGEMVIVGNGDKLSKKQKEWLHSLSDCKCECNGECDCDSYDEGYDDGYADATDEYEGVVEVLENIKELLEEAGMI